MWRSTEWRVRARWSRPGLTASRTPIRTVDPLVAAFYEGDGPWWPPERVHVEDGYRQLPFPFAPLPAPEFEIRAAWPLERLLGYFGTWSAVNRCRRQTGHDPLKALGRRLAQVWGDPSEPRPVRWPLHLRVGRVAGGHC
jgi:hypothetical protein